MNLFERLTKTAEQYLPDGNPVPVSEKEPTLEVGTDGQITPTKRKGAMSVSNSPAGVDKTSSELMDDLEKTAANKESSEQLDRLEKTAGAGLRRAKKALGDWGKDFSGKNVKNAYNDYTDFATDVKTINLPKQQFKRKEEGLKNKVESAEKKRTQARLEGGIVAGVGVAGGLKAREKMKKREEKKKEKTANEALMERLEKSAAPIGALKGLTSGATNFAKNVTGTGVKKANRELGNFWENQSNASLSVADFTKKNQQLTDNVSKATQAQTDARKKIGIGAGAFGAGSLTSNNGGNNMTQSKQANDLMARLEKTAAEKEKESKKEKPKRQDRKTSTELLVGGGPLAPYAKKNNKLGVKEDDSHTAANAKLGALGGAITGAGLGAASGAINNRLGMPGASGPKKAVSTAISNGITGALSGGLVGSFHDRWDKKHPVEKEASEMLERLSKTAKECMTNEAACAPKTEQKAESKADDAEKKKDAEGFEQESAGCGTKKQASENEEFMSDLYKEAAASIIEENMKVESYEDPMSKIAFSR